GENTEHRDRELRDVDADEGEIERIRTLALAVLPAVSRRKGGDHGDGDRQQKRDAQRPLRRADAPELRPLGEQDARERDHARCVKLWDARRGGAHATTSSVRAPNSTSSRVRSMKASSSDACCGVSSWSAMPAAAAVSPICSALRPWTSIVPRSP